MSKSVSASLVMFLAATSCSRAMADATWCSINPSSTRQGAAVELGSANIHLVQESMQIDAQKLLAKSTLLIITQEESTRWTGVPAASSNLHYYLVRAGALSSQMSAWIYPSDKRVEMVNYSLSRRGTIPTNLAVVIATNYVIDHADGVCLTAE